MKNKKILITGGLGFIGIHCVEKWNKLGYDVTIIDNLSSNALPPTDDIFKDCKIIIEDILNVDITQLEKFDIILHLASPVGPVGVLKHSGKMASIIIDDIYWVIKAAKYNKCPLLFVSTSEVYGYRDSKTYLKEDEAKVLNGEFTVRNEYAMAKLLAEIVLSNTSKTDPNFKYQTIRPFNVSGRYQLPENGFVLPRFVNQALNKENITVYYDGLQLRAFTWVKDIVEGIYLTSIASEEYWNQEWNIGNEKNENTILYLATKVKEITNSDSSIINIDPTILHGSLFAEAPEKIPNSEKIKSLLGWEATKETDDIIKEVIDYFNSKK
jgi:nucleoside-diphosphate-sugar epimerase